MNAARWFAVCVLLVLSGGCASTREGALNPAWFPRVAVAPDSRIAGRVALLVTPQVRNTSHDAMREARVNVRLPTGQITEQAGLAALGDAMKGGVQSLEAPLPPRSGAAATVVVDAVRTEVHRRILWMVPVPPPLFVIGDSALETRMAFDMRLIDAQGHTAWTRTYDSGAEVLKHDSIFRNETTPENLARMTHEAAWRLWQQVVADLRDWMAAERNKPREL